MLRIFRKVKQKLLDEGRLRKYLITSLGEVLLIVIGILIALNVDNWNAEIKDRKQEKEILGQLIKEFNKNNIQLKQKISIRNDLIQSAYFLLESIDNDTGQITSDSLEFHLGRTFVTPTFDPFTGVITELINSGKLYLLRDVDLKTLLSNWTGIVNDYREDEQIYLIFSSEIYLPYLINNFQVRNAVVSLRNNKSMNLKWKTTQTLVKDISTNNEIDYQHLFKNQDFEDYLTLILYYSINTNDMALDLKGQLNAIVDNINNEINK